MPTFICIFIFQAVWMGTIPSMAFRDQPDREISGFGMTWHYAEMLPDGNLLAIIKDGMILELDWSHLNKIVWEWKAEEHLAEEHLEELKKLVDLPHPLPEQFRDWPHINTVEMLPQNPVAGKDPRFSAGNIMFCGRHINAIWIVDRNSGKVLWAWGPGVLQGPHMPTMLSNGHIMVYDNGHWTGDVARGYTRIIELDPLTGKIVWMYKADPPEDFYSHSRGSGALLPNGNVLIAESNSGHLFEVTRDALYRAVPYSFDLVEKLLWL